MLTRQQKKEIHKLYEESFELPYRMANDEIKDLISSFLDQFLDQNKNFESTESISLQNEVVLTLGDLLGCIDAGFSKLITSAQEIWNQYMNGVQSDVSELIKTVVSVWNDTYHNALFKPMVSEAHKKLRKLKNRVIRTMYWGSPRVYWPQYYDRWEDVSIKM